MSYEEAFPNRIGYYKPSHRVKVFFNGRWEKGTVCTPLHYHGSDEVSVLCDRRVHNRKYGGGYGLLAAVCSEEIKYLRNEKFDDDFSPGRRVMVTYKDICYSGTICQRSGVPNCRVAILCDEALPRFYGIRLFAQNHGVIALKKNVQLI